MIDSDIELLIGPVARAGAEPVLVDASAGKVGLWKVAHHLLCHGINQIAGNTGIGTARARPKGEVVKANKCAAYHATRVGIENSGVRIPDLTGCHAAQAIIIECPSLGGTHLAKIAGPHGIAGNGSSTRA